MAKNGGQQSDFCVKGVGQEQQFVQINRITNFLSTFWDSLAAKIVTPLPSYFKGGHAMALSENRLGENRIRAHRESDYMESATDEKFDHVNWVYTFFFFFWEGGRTNSSGKNSVKRWEVRRMYGFFFVFFLGKSSRVEKIFCGGTSANVFALHSCICLLSMTQQSKSNGEETERETAKRIKDNTEHRTCGCKYWGCRANNSAPDLNNLFSEFQVVDFKIILQTSQIY